MPIVVTTKCRQFEHYPWYEFTQDMEWEDDEFEDIKWGTIEQRRTAASDKNREIRKNSNEL